MPVLGICVRCAQDERIDDRPALAELGETDRRLRPAMRRPVGSRTPVYSWAVCEPTTGEMLAEVTLSTRWPRTLSALRARAGHADAAARPQQMRCAGSPTRSC